MNTSSIIFCLFTNGNYYFKELLFIGYQASYSQLVFCGQKEHDPCKDVPNTKVFLGKTLKHFNNQFPTKVHIFCDIIFEGYILLHLIRKMNSIPDDCIDQRFTRGCG